MLPHCLPQQHGGGRPRRLPQPPPPTQWGPTYAWTTPLTAAIAIGHLGIVDYLVTHQTPAQCTHAEKLQASVQMGLSGQVRRLLEDPDGAIDLEAQMQDIAETFEHGAPREGRQDIVEMLVDAGASVHVGMDSVQDAPLIFFAAADLPDFCRAVTPAERMALVMFLIKRGALYCEAQWEAFAQGNAHLDGLDVAWLDECEVIKSAVAELQMTWGDTWVAAA